MVVTCVLLLLALPRDVFVSLHIALFDVCIGR